MHVWEGDPFRSQNFAHSECAKTTYCSLRIGTKPNATPGVLPNFLMMPDLSLALPPRWMAPIEGTGFSFVRHNWLCNSSWLKPNRSTTTELLRRVFLRVFMIPPLHYPAVENDHFAKERMVLERQIWFANSSWKLPAVQKGVPFEVRKVNKRDGFISPYRKPKLLYST